MSSNVNRAMEACRLEGSTSETGARLLPPVPDQHTATTNKWMGSTVKSRNMQECQMQVSQQIDGVVGGSSLKFNVQATYSAGDRTGPNDANPGPEQKISINGTCIINHFDQ